MINSNPVQSLGRLSIKYRHYTREHRREALIFATSRRHQDGFILFDSPEKFDSHFRAEVAVVSLQNIAPLAPCGHVLAGLDLIPGQVVGCHLHLGGVFGEKVSFSDVMDAYSLLLAGNWMKLDRP